MKKIFTLSMALGFGLLLSAFSSAPKETKNYNDVTSVNYMNSIEEVSTFQEAEQSATTEDKGGWTYRHKIWTDFSEITHLQSIENILNQN